MYVHVHPHCHQEILAWQELPKGIAAQWGPHKKQADSEAFNRGAGIGSAVFL